MFLNVFYLVSSIGWVSQHGGVDMDMNPRQATNWDLETAGTIMLTIRT